MAIDPRKQVFTQYYFPQRKDMGARIKGYSNKQAMGGDMGGDMGGFPDYKQAATALYGAGLKADAQGNMVSTQDYGKMVQLESQNLNSLSRGTPGGFSSSLGKPPGSMYAQDPTAFKNMQNPYYAGGNIPGFGAAVAQRNQDMSQSPSQASQTPAYQGPYRPGFTGLTEQQKSMSRAGLQEKVDAKRMLGQATGNIPTVAITPDMSGKTGGSVAISGKYGTGSSTFLSPGAPRKEGLINGKPASEVLQGLANKPGIARAGDRFQPQKSTPAESAAMNKALSKFPLKNPLVKNK